MKLLLDTHVWIWAMQNPEKLTRTVLKQLSNAKNELYLSPVSIWEARHLHRKGRLRVKQSFGEWLDRALAKTPLREAPFNFAAAAQSAAIELPQSDIGDVFLAATAVVFNLTLVTNDEQLCACSWLKTLPNV